MEIEKSLIDIIVRMVKDPDSLSQEDWDYANSIFNTYLAPLPNQK